MIRGLYSAASALDAAATNQELVAENLAHANTPGYRRHGLVFEAVQQNASDDQALRGERLGGTRAASGYTTFDAGPVQYTGNPLDLALSGSAFFVLDGPNGPVYTRNGSFQMNAQGQLQSQAGLPVRSQGGPITIPPNTARIDVTKDGTILANDVEVGKLQLADFSDPSALQRVGTTLFEGPTGRQPDPQSFRVEQGYREGSNVQIVNEMVSMLTGMRFYEAAEKALQALGVTVRRHQTTVAKEISRKERHYHDACIQHQCHGHERPASRAGQYRQQPGQPQYHGFQI